MTERKNEPLLQPLLPVHEDELQALRAIGEMYEEEIRKVPENIFVDHILPMMLGGSERVALSNWVAVAGNPQVPFDVVDPSGTVLYRVPALLATGRTLPSAPGRHSMSVFLQQAELYQKRHPREGEAFLRMGLKRRLPDGGLAVEQARQWSAILQRYGHPPLPGVEVVADSPTATTGEASAAPFITDEYDEL